MTTITIQNLDDETMQKLSRMAEANGHSVEDEARDILVSAVHQAMLKGLGTLIAQEFEAVGGVELELPVRSLPAANKEKGL
ncbi:MAG: plasmid stabilization protein [Ardenticatenaceae bacterium]|nr:plasmid stabilization protein [Ardenticatenaceae bacterium]